MRIVKRRRYVVVSISWTIIDNRHSGAQKGTQGGEQEKEGDQDAQGGETAEDQDQQGREMIVCSVFVSCEELLPSLDTGRWRDLLSPICSSVPLFINYS